MLITKSAEEIAELVSGRLVGTCANALQGVASLSEATETDVSFLGNEKYREQVKPSRAGVVLVPPDYEVEPPEGRAWIVCNAPSDAFTQVVLAFTPPPVNYAPGVHPTASIDPTVYTAENGRQISRRMLENKRAIAARREEMAREVFAAVREKILAWSPLVRNRLTFMRLLHTMLI